MELYEREFFISRIDAGYMRYRNRRGDILRIYAPDKHIMYEAQEIYCERYQDALIQDVMSQDDALDVMKNKNIWTDEMEVTYKQLPKDIEKFKVSMYECLYKSVELNKYRKYLNVAKAELKRLNEIRNSLDHVTAEGVANFAKWQFIICNSVFYSDGRPYGWDFEDPFAVMTFHNSNLLSESQIRELAREEPWASYWTVRKLQGRIFDGNITTEQKALILWSNMYDNIRKSHNAPHDSVIKDDDILDGWLIIQKREQEKQQAKKRSEEFTENEKIKKAGEVFLPANTEEDAQKIDILNSDYSRAVKTSRVNKVQKEGEVQVQNFGDVKQKLKQDLIKQYSDTVKGIGK